MGRPTKRSDGFARELTHPVWLTEIEFGKLKRQAYEAGVPFAELVRTRALRREVEPPEITRALSEQYSKQLRQHGQVLNGIVKEVNRKVLAGKGAVISDARWQPLLRISQIVREIFKQLSNNLSQNLAIESRRYNNQTPKRIQRSIRLASDEYELLKKKSHHARTSVAEFIRRAALGLQVTSPPPPPESHFAIHSELAAINNNLKQFLDAIEFAIETGQEISLKAEIEGEEFPDAIRELIEKSQTVGLLLLDAFDREAEAESA